MTEPSYCIELQNNTDKSYHLAVFQRYSNSPELRSVFWKVKGLPPKGIVPSTSVLKWSADYGVCIADWDEKRERYLERQIIRAQLGQAYKVSIVDCGIPCIYPNPVGETDDGCISFANSTEETLTLGITLDLSLLAVQTVKAGESLNFCAESTYSVSCYRYIQPGQVTILASVLSPVDVAFDDGYDHCRVVATNKNGKRFLQVSKFCA